MQPEHFPKKYWSPNSPFSNTCVFSAKETASFVRRSIARLMPLPEAMAALTENMEPKRWRAQWLVEKFISMGMPKRLATDGMVLMFLPDFVGSIRRNTMEENRIKIEDMAFDAMIDASRGGHGRVGFAVWTGRQTHFFKVAGLKTFKIRHMQIRFKP